MVIFCSYIPQYSSAPCGKRRDGGCDQYATQKIKTLEGRHTESGCREACAKEPDCRNFLHGKSTGEVPNKCSLYIKGSEIICTSKDRTNWVFYALEECKTVIKGKKVFNHRTPSLIITRPLPLHEGSYQHNL